MKLEALAPRESIHIGADDFVILERQACFGPCPFYSVTVHGDGRVTAFAEQWVAHQGSLDWTMLRRRDNAALTRLELLVHRISEAETQIVGCTSRD